QTGSAELTATVPAFDAPGVTFAIQIVPVRRIVQVVGGPGTLVDPGARAASLLLSASRSSPLRGRVIDARPREPAAGEIVFFSVPEDARAGFGSSAARSARATTNDSGEAQAFLLARGVEPGFVAQAFCPDASEGVFFTVTLLGDPASGCDCPDGTVCVDGVCEPAVPKDPVLPDVTGAWQTKHAFDLRASLPAGLRFAFRA